MDAETSKETFLGGLGTALRDALLITVACGALGLLVNLFHPEKIPYIAEEEYETLVPCPEPGGEVTPLEPSDPALQAKETFVVDARTKEAHAEWNFRGAMNVPYDYLDPTPDEVIHELAKKIAKSRAQRVAVYGDGDRPDTGEQLGKEISGKGIKNVYFVKGGAPALKQPGSPEGGQ
jgi:predicted sulfurtransferase